MSRCLMLLLLMFVSIASSAQEAYSVYIETDSTLTFYFDELRSTRPGATYSVEITDSVPDWYENRYKVLKVVFDSTFVDARPTSTYSWFITMNNLVSITGINYLKTDSVTNMGFMFAGCTSLDSLDVSGFNTSKVTNMGFMFAACTSLGSLDVSSFNTSNVIDMEDMFANCESLTSLDLSGFNTENVEDMIGMFSGCRFLTHKGRWVLPYDL